MTYPQGAVKQDFTTQSVAVKLPEGSPLGEWAFMTLTAGGGFCTHQQVEGWQDLIRPNPEGVS